MRAGDSVNPLASDASIGTNPSNKGSIIGCIQRFAAANGAIGNRDMAG
jgi:hypothetical protein